MANSKIIITFEDIPVLNSSFRILESSLSLNMLETFRTNRIGINQVKIPNSVDIGFEGDPLFVYSGYVSENYKTAFNLDHNSTGLFTVTSTNGASGSGLGTVTIEANYPGAEFSTSSLPAGVSAEIINEEAGAFITIDNVSYLEAETNPCENVSVQVETSVLATRIVSSIPIVPPTEPSQNLVLYSNDMSNSIWEKIRATTIGNKFIPNTVDSNHGIRQFITKEAVAGNYTFSFYAKAAELFIVDFFAMRSAGSGSAWSAFNLNTQEVFYAYGVGEITYISHSLTDAGGGFYRFSMTLALPADNQVIFNISVRSATGESTFPGNNSDGVILERFQLNKLGLLPYLQTTSTALEVEESDGTVIDPNTDNPFQITVPRATSFSLSVENADGNTDSRIIQTPSVLSQFNFSLSFINSPNGATVTVSNVNSSGLNLEYSLDGETWQSSNIFPGLAPDDYTLHVRDHLGCSFTLNFTVIDNNVNVPFFYLSKSNSIRFAQRITWGDAANYKTDENTLSCEVNVGIPYHEVQLFQTADVITTQFKSNYGTHTVKVVKSDQTEDSVPVTQVTSFRGLKDKRDAKKYDLGNGKVGIYFTSGNIYDYDTGVASGVHNLNGLVPEWGVAGNYVSIGSSWFLIERVFFDENKNADVLVITESFSLSEITVVVGCIYDIYPYDVFEFPIDMSTYIDQSIRVKIECTDDNFSPIEFLSEQIDVAVRHENTLDINYWNDDNNDVYYASGIRHRIRPIFTKIEGVVEQESEMHKTDTNALLLSADLYEGDRFIFEPTTKEIWRKLMAALSHKNVFIDGVKYIKNGDFETEGPLEESNLYVLKAPMLKAGNVYNSDGSTFGAGNASNSEIPGILEGNNGFLSY